MRRHNRNPGRLPDHAKCIPELGCPILDPDAHSGIWMAWALSKTGGKLITIEIDPERHRQALANFKEAGLSDYIDARLADAHKPVAELPGPFDFVFSDADKDWYAQYLRGVLPKLEIGGCFTAHNVTMRSRGITEFLDYLKGLPLKLYPAFLNACSARRGFVTSRRMDPLLFASGAESASRRACLARLAGVQPVDQLRVGRCFQGKDEVVRRKEAFQEVAARRAILVIDGDRDRADIGCRSHRSLHGRGAARRRSPGAGQAAHAQGRARPRSGTPPSAPGHHRRGTTFSRGRLWIRRRLSFGKRFLMILQADTEAAAPREYRVVVNWFEELKRLVPSG